MIFTVNRYTVLPLLMSAILGGISVAIAVVGYF